MGQRIPEIEHGQERRRRYTCIGTEVSDKSLNRAGSTQYHWQSRWIAVRDSGSQITGEDPQSLLHRHSSVDVA